MLHVNMKYKVGELMIGASQNLEKENHTLDNALLRYSRCGSI